MARIAIHGFGRIGRSLMKAALKANLFTPISISDIRDIPTFAALFEVDSNYGRWHEEVKTTDKGFVIGRREIPYYDSMKELPSTLLLRPFNFDTLATQVFTLVSLYRYEEAGLSALTRP